MSLQIIELNDSEIRVASNTEIVLRSPGLAVIDKTGLILGEAAALQSRLQPRASFDRFWDNLNQDPLKYPAAKVRHHADLAYAHLLAIHKLAGQPEDILFAVPGNFNNEQLALLLGLAEAAPFNAIGLVDSAVAAVAAVAGKGEFIHADIHLHNTVLTHIRVADRVTRSAVQVIDGIGMAEILDACAYAIADLFIKQSRFDPQHLPETEQALYNQIPACLQTLLTDKEVQLEITSQRIQHQVKINAAILADALQHHYRKIYNAIPATASVLISDRLSILPGFREQIICAGILDETRVFQGCQANLLHIRSTDQGPALSFVTSLPSAASPQIITTARTEAREVTPDKVEQSVTHVLHNNCAWPLGEQPLYLSVAGVEPTTTINGARCSLRTDRGRPVLAAENGASIYLNGRRTALESTVVPGDILTFPSSNTSYTFICVKG